MNLYFNIEKLESELKLTDFGEMVIAPNLTSIDLNVKNNEYGTLKRMIGVTTMAYEELPDVPLYYLTDKLCSVTSSVVPSMIKLKYVLYVYFIYLL